MNGENLTTIRMQFKIQIVQLLIVVTHNVHTIVSH